MVKMKAALHLDLFDAAVNAASKCFDDSNSKHAEKQNAIVSVVMSWASLEAYINKVIDETRNLHGLDDEEIRAMSTRTKYTVLPKLFNRQTFDKSKEPFESFIILNSLRNLIVHFSGKWEDMGTWEKMGADYKPEKIEKMCKSKFKINEGRMTWNNKILNRHCAKWACRTVIDFLEEFGNLVKDIRGAEYLFPMHSDKDKGWWVSKKEKNHDFLYGRG